MLAALRSALGNDFRLCVWPTGKVSTGSTAPILQGWGWFVFDPAASALGIEPGPASYDRSYADNVHLASAAEYLWMGIRGARNAMSYFVAKANAADTIPHYGAGPVIETLIRHPGGTSQVMFAAVRAKDGYVIQPSNPWINGDTNWLNGFAAAWGIGDHAAVPLTGAQLSGGWIKLYTSWTFTYPMWVSYQGDQTFGTTNVVYDTNMQWGDQGQPMLPLALGGLTSN
jgi:hypothetical protein